MESLRKGMVLGHVEACNCIVHVNDLNVVDSSLTIISNRPSLFACFASQVLLSDITCTLHSWFSLLMIDK